VAVVKPGVCLAAAFAVLFGVNLSRGQLIAEDSPAQPFRWTVTVSPATASPGDTVWVSARLDIDDRHFVYAERTDVRVPPELGFRVGRTLAPSPYTAFDRFEGKPVPKLKGRFEFRTPLFLTQTANPGRLTIPVEVRTQGCSEEMCFFPSRQVLATAITVVPRAGTASRAPQEIVPSSPKPAKYAAPVAQAGDSASRPAWNEGFNLGSLLAERGFLFALGLIFLGGVLTSFTPCVYPLIPITVSFFASRGSGGAKNPRLRGPLLSAVFVLGMATMYSLLGVLAAATGAVFGAVMANPVVIGAVALLFAAFALSMFGAFEIALPVSLQTRLSAIGGAGGLTGVFAAGLVAGIVAAPCTGPVLGAVLTYVATTGNTPFGFVALFVYALGMGLLFVVIGTFSSSLMPKPGPWLEKIKSVFGIAMLAMAVYFLRGIFLTPRSPELSGPLGIALSLALTFLGLLVGAVHLRFRAGFDREGNPETPPTMWERSRKAAGIILCVAGIYGVVLVVTAAPAKEAATANSVSWESDEASAVARAREQRKPVLIDAYAEWCVACRELDAITFADPRVQQRLRSYVTVKLDFTATTPETQKLRQKYGIVGLPTVLVLDENGVEEKEKRLVGFEPPDKFLKRLDRSYP